MHAHAPTKSGADTAGRGPTPAASEARTAEPVQPPASAQLFQRAAGGAAASSPPSTPSASAGAAGQPSGVATAGGAERGPFGVIVDDGTTLGPGQVHRTAFYESLSRDIERTAEDVLHPSGYGTSDCPYLAHWLAFYRERPAAHLERAILHYARPAGHGSAGDLRTAVLERVRQAAQEWLRTGRVSGLPAELRLLGGDDRLPDEAASAAPRPLAKAEPGAASAGPARAAGPLRARVGPGQPLDAAVRAPYERGLGLGLAHVRVHTDSTAAALAHGERARALALGSDVVFGARQFQPGTLEGDLLLAHELAHVAQQRGASGGRAPVAPTEALERDADRAAVALVARTRPRAEREHALTAHGVEPARAGALNAWAEALSPAVASAGALRLQRCMMPSTAERDERTIAQVRADLEASGDLGPRADVRPLPADYAPVDFSATPLSAQDRAALAPNPATLTHAEMALDLDQILAQIEQLQPLVAGRPTGETALAQARAQVAAVRPTIGSADAAGLSRRILRTRVVLEQSRRALAQLALSRPALTAPGVMHAGGYGREFDRVTALFDAAVGRALQDDVLARFQDADRAAADLPQALMRADLASFASLQAGAALLQPSMRDIHAWAARLSTRLTALQARAREVAAARASHAADLPTREARFRDESDSIALSIEALSYWEQLARGYAYMAGNPPYDMRAFDGIARLMVRVRHMRDADERGDVALLEVLVRRYREDADIQRFINNLGVFVAFSRFAVSMGIVLVAAMASAGIGAGATAVIGTTTTTAGTVTAFVGVTALEALTFTAVSRALQSVLPGQQTRGTFLGELAWNFGLFFVLKLANLGVAAATRSVGVPSFTRLVSHTVSYPLLLGYGAIHQRVATGEWPTSEQFDRMAAETLFMMAGFAIATRGRGTASVPRELQVFRARYGLQFEALNAGRQALADRIIEASRSAAAPDAVRADVSGRARILEDNLRSLLDRIRADPDIRLPELRNALRGFGANTEAFALQTRLMEAGLNATELAAAEARLAAVPEPVREATAVQVRTAVEYATRTVGDVAQRRAALEVVTRVGTNPRIGGFPEWVRFSTAQSPGTVPAEQARNFLDDVGELQVAETMSQTAGRGQRVEVGGDASRRLRPGTSDQFLPSFDIRVVGAPQARQVEVFSPAGARPDVGDFGTAINHAADKVISDPSLPAGFRTTGRVEAAVRIPWPVPDRVTGGGTIVTAPNGEITLVQGNGVRRPLGNFFGDYVATLNGERGGRPAGVNRVDVLTVYDRAGNMLYRYTRSAGRWTGVAF